MKYSNLSDIITKKAYRLRDDAAYNGAYDDGGCNQLLQKLMLFKMDLITEYDLRPSEYDQLEDREVGEPEEFKGIIEEYKLKLAKQITKDFEL